MPYWDHKKDCRGNPFCVPSPAPQLLRSSPPRRFLRGLRPLVSGGPLPLPVSGGGHVRRYLAPPLIPPAAALPRRRSAPNRVRSPGESAKMAKNELSPGSRRG